MARNKLSDLRDHLFETIELLKDDEYETKMTVEKALAISSVSQTIINSAKLELDYIKTASSFSGLKTVTDFLGTPKLSKDIKSAKHKEDSEEDGDEIDMEDKDDKKVRLQKALKSKFNGDEAED